MTQREEKQSKGCSNPVIIAAFIAGIFAIIAALIGAYAVLVAGSRNPGVPLQTDSQTAEIAGTWTGTIHSVDGAFETEAVYTVQVDCELGKVCGTYDTPNLGCKGDLIFNGANGNTYEFIERKTSGPDFCADNGVDRFTLYSSSQLNTSYSLNGEVQSSGILTRK